MIQPIETSRTVLRPFTPDDAAAFYRMGSDPEIVRFTADPGGGFRDPAHASEILQSHPIADYAKYGYGRLAVVWKETGEVIGFCGLKYLEEYGEVDLGFRFFPEYWGLGLATETGRAVLEHAFAVLELDEIIAFVLPANAGSIRVLEKLGLERQGILEYDGNEAWRYSIRNPRGASGPTPAPMRHKKREVADREWMHAFLDETGHGTLASTGEDGWPVQREVNFVRVGDAIYFHGAHKGEKMDVLAHDDRVSFLAVKAYSLIPSFFTDKERACPATQFYRSVLVRGRAAVVSDREEKATALQALMEKLQPEGGYVPITADSDLYRSSIDGTAVIRIDVLEMTGKDNVGQDKTGESAEQIEEGLRERGTALDHETLEAMRKSRPGGSGGNQ